MQSLLSVSFKIDGIPGEGNCPGMFWKMCREGEKSLTTGPSGQRLVTCSFQQCERLNKVYELISLIRWLGYHVQTI